MIRSGAICLPRSLPAAWRWSLIVWVSARLALSAWGWLIWQMGLIPPGAGQKFYFGVAPINSGWKGALLGVWQRWDAIHYVRIAQNGYQTQDLSAFFPLFPLLGKLASYLTFGDALFGLMLVSNLALIFAFVLLYQLVEEEYSTDLAIKTLVCLAIFPTSFFLFAPYPQSLSLFLVLLAYHAARKSRWALACTAGLAAGLTHSTALPLAFVLGWVAWLGWRKKSYKVSWLAAIAPICPLAGTGLFLAWRAWAGFSSYSGLQNEKWGLIVQAPWWTFADFTRMAAAGELLYSSWINLALLVLIITILIWKRNKVKTPHLIYMVCLMAYIMVITKRFEPFSSLGRYSLLLFPMFISLALWLQDSHHKRAGLILGSSFHLLLSGLFILWFWVD